jgi:transcriptional regulator with GAF, ATPase, and Fis domain
LAGSRWGPWAALAGDGPIAGGATSHVWRARHVDTGALGAVKAARATADALALLAREAALLARVRRRWGPALLDAGKGFLVTEWIEGTPVVPGDANAGAPALGRRGQDERERLGAMLAHALGRALEELHQSGVFHGDVKPGNVLWSPSSPTRDVATERAATLIDLGLAVETHAIDAAGGTARYASPELRARGEGAPTSDLWALGVLLAEVLDPGVAQAADPVAAVGSWGRNHESEPARWVEALLARAPGGRPSAGWIAVRAARWLGLATDPEEAGRDRVERVRRTYLALRSREVAPGATVGAAVSGPARAWLEEAIAMAGRVVDGQGAGPAPGVLGSLGPVGRARWLVAMVGPSAASWPLGLGRVPGADNEGDDGALSQRATILAQARDPASWTFGDIVGSDAMPASAWGGDDDPDAVARLVRELARAAPHPDALALAEDRVARSGSSPTLALQLASALARAGDVGRAWLALSRVDGPGAAALRAEILRRRGESEAARAVAERGLSGGDAAATWSAQATLARLAWDAGDLTATERLLAGARGPAAAEVAALLAWRRGQSDSGLEIVALGLAESPEGEAQGRLEGVRGLLELSRGDVSAALSAFGRAVELSTRAGAVVDEATYLTSEAAAAADAGDLGRALDTSTRAALLWERLGRPARAARAWLARAGALATVGALHAADEAAEEARARALESGDSRATAYARWAQVEVRAPGDERARAWAVEAAGVLLGGDAEDQLRAGARLLVWAPSAIGAKAILDGDRQTADAGAAARWEWWGARARASLAAETVSPDDAAVLGALLALLDVPAALGSRGPALDAAARLATRMGNGDAARRFELARASCAKALREAAPPALRPGLVAIPWARETALGVADVSFAPAQVAQLEAIVRALSARDGLRSLLQLVMDTMILWAGVERGLLLLRAPDGRLVPRAARNLARHDLEGEQLALSQTIARRAVETRDAVVATDAFSTLGDAHASVHALRLRSVLAVPLLARGEILGVVYLDDRVRRGAFGPAELAWVRVLASQAAMAIADARDAVLLRRALRRAERARARVEAVLGDRETELQVTRTELQLARDGHAGRFRYDDIVGRSEPMREMLRMVDRVTASDVPVLIVGESGTGKELVARALHTNGPRGRRAFVSENCASVPETLLESTLFGHVRGAFTGASSTRAGLFDVADGGTLFLDEIGEMSLGMQSKLLRVLQGGEVRPVGGDRPRQVDVRIIGATHRDLEAMVAAGTFREDLFYRLNVITLRLPALRERTEDIPALVEHFVAKHAQGAPVKVARAAMAKLAAFPWPGNVRQLENEIRRALVLGEGAIEVDTLSDDVARGGPAAARGSGLDLRGRVDALESTLLTEALTKTRGNQTRAAQMLGLSRFGLQKMMKRLGVKAPS